MQNYVIIVQNYVIIVAVIPDIDFSSSEKSLSSSVYPTVSSVENNNNYYHYYISKLSIWKL